MYANKRYLSESSNEDPDDPKPLAASEAGPGYTQFWPRAEGNGHDKFKRARLSSESQQPEPEAAKEANRQDVSASGEAPVGLDGIDVISDAENIKQLLRLPFNRSVSHYVFYTYHELT